MRNEKLYLVDIVDAADRIASMVSGLTEEEWIDDDARRDGVMYRLIIIGEAASHLTAEFRSSHPTINWRSIVGFRNFAVHEYFAADWGLVWLTVREDLPQLADHIIRILRDEFGEQTA